MKNYLFHQNSQIFFSSCEVHIGFFKTFVSTLCYNNNNNGCDYKMFFHWRCSWVKCCFYSFT